MSIDPTRCKEQVWSGSVFHSRQCNRKAVKDGYCNQHHPDAVKARAEAAEAKYKERMAKSPYAQLAKLKTEHDKLETQNKEVLGMLKKLDSYFSIIEEPHLHDEITTLIAKIEAKK